MHKKCFKCGVIKNISCFYKHPQMADGHLNKCKSCTKKDTSNNYSKRKEYYAEYESNRNKNEERRAKKLKYQRKHRTIHEEKYKARMKLGNAIRDKRLVKKECFICGSNDSEAHHYDYSKPLDVLWLCRTCHLLQHGKESYESIGVSI